MSIYLEPTVKTGPDTRAHPVVCGVKDVGFSVLCVWSALCFVLGMLLRVLLVLAYGVLTDAECFGMVLGLAGEVTGMRLYLLVLVWLDSGFER